MQLGAGVLAALLVRTVIDPVAAAKTAALTLSGHSLVAAFVVELLFTAALCYVVLNVATSKSHPDNSFYGLAIGFTVVAGAAAVGTISGGAFNPAVTLGAAVMGMFAWPTLWVYVLAQLIGGIAAASTFVALNPTTSSARANHALAPTDTTSRGNHDRHPTPADDNRCRYPGLQ